MVQKSSSKKSEQRVRKSGKQAKQLQQSSEKLRESEERFRTLFENGPEAMVIIDAEAGKFMDANTKALQLFKLGREEFIGIGPLDISPPQQPDGRASKESIQEKIQELLDENPKPFEWVHRDGFGRDFLCEIRHSRLPMFGRKLYSAIAIDITEHAEDKRYSGLAEGGASSSRSLLAIPISAMPLSLAISRMLSSKFTICFSQISIYQCRN